MHVWRTRSPTSSRRASSRRRPAPAGRSSMAERSNEPLDLVEQAQLRRAGELEQQVRAFVQPRGDERALDVGSGLGALALALAPQMREVVGVEPDAERVERAQALAAAAGADNVEFVVANGTSLPFELAAFDFAGTMRTLHHVRRPELVIAEL